MKATPAIERGGPVPDALDDLCRTVFESLPRADQRHWAQTYVRGLVTLPGRKSVRRISAQVGDPSIEQSLQQFVNQSPWDWAPVRRVLARATEATVPARAWVLQEIEFPKDGTHSVGVGAQFAPQARRSVNCQLGLAAWLAGEDAAVPVNWRLMLPPCWDEDPARRMKAGLPDAERHRPGWEHILGSLDEMVGSWHLTPRPVLGDRRHDRQLEPLLRGLDERGLRYALRIGDRTPVPPTSCLPRRLVARWPHGRSRPGQLWLTNLITASMPEMLGIFGFADRVIRASDGLRAESGLDHFEGRSFRGWHHHVTLTSVAHAHRVLPPRRRLVPPCARCASSSRLETACRDTIGAKNTASFGRASTRPFPRAAGAPRAPPPPSSPGGGRGRHACRPGLGVIAWWTVSWSARQSRSGPFSRC